MAKVSWTEGGRKKAAEVCAMTSKAWHDRRLLADQLWRCASVRFGKEDMGRVRRECVRALVGVEASLLHAMFRERRLSWQESS